MADEKSGKNREDYKRVNRGLALQLIATGEATNRADLARRMGLSKMALSNIVSEMLQNNLLQEGAAENTAGELANRTKPLAISPDAPKIAGIQVDRSAVRAVICDLRLQVLKREEVQYTNQMDRESLIICIYQILDTLLYGRNDVIAIGASSIGPVSATEGMILRPLFFYDISDIPLRELLEERYKLPVFLNHDNQCAVLAEKLFGNGRGYKDILLIGGGSGIGCGILCNGLPFANSRGLAPELGHISIDLNGKKCLCGNRGCLEAYIRLPELLKQMRERTGKYFSYELFCSMKDDPNVNSVFEEAANKLAAAVVSTVNLLNSELILISGQIALWDDCYLQQMERIINENRFVEWDSPVLVKRAHFGSSAPLVGAAAEVLERIFSGELLFNE